MKKPSKKTLTTKLDKICSKIIRSRGQCEKCGETSYEKLQCAHIYSRTLRSTRWLTDNLLCLCWSCHAKFHQRPAEFGVWLKETHLGKEKYEALKNRAQQIKKWTIPEMQELLDKLTKDFKEGY